MARKETGNSERLRHIRRELRLTQKELAEAMGVRSNTVARWERGDLALPRVAELAAEYIRVTSKTKRRKNDEESK